MSEELELKTISKDHVPRAIEKAEHYRLLNQPEEAESICLDVLAVEPENQRALVIIVLAITDQFAEGKVAPRRAKQFLSKVTDPYRRTYYAGLIAEREARSYVTRKLPGGFAYASFREAMELYLEADGLATDHNDDSLLRYNSCLRTIRRHNLKERDHGNELPLE